MKIQLYKFLHKQQGLSLVELMVALVLSLVVLLVTTGIYVSNKQTYRFLDSYSLLQENGRFAIFFLRQYILEAGYPRVPTGAVNAFPILPVENTGPNNSDSIIVQFRSPLDCANAVTPLMPPITGQPTATNSFSIVQPPGAVPQLQCNGEPLVDGIEAMQVEYGLDTSGDLIADTYANSTQVQASVSGASWDEVVSVRVAILVQGQANALDQAQVITYNLLGTPYPATDRTPRRVFTTTIPLRNKNKSII